MLKPEYTTQELANILSITTQYIARRAKRESWQSHPKPGRGGGSLWVVSSMPEATQLKLNEVLLLQQAKQIKQREAVNIQTATQDTVLNPVNEPIKNLERTAARAFLVRLSREFSLKSDLAPSMALIQFCKLYRNLKIEVPAWVRGIIPSISRNTLVNWEKKLQAKGVVGLNSKSGKHLKNRNLIESTPDMAECIIAEILEFYTISAVEIHQALEARFLGQALPSLRTLQLWIKQYKELNKNTILKIQNPDAWRSKYLAAAGSRSAGLERVNQLWELDSSPTDIILTDGSRHTLIGCIEVVSRRVIFHLAKTSSSQGVCSLLRKALLQFGVPELIKMDNGADYTSAQIMAVLSDLAIPFELCAPFSPQEKPHIERVFRTFQHSFVTRLPGFIGHSVADRKAIESRKSFGQRMAKSNKEASLQLNLTAQEFQQICDTWARDIYGEKVHSELGLSPNELASKNINSVTKPEERALDLLLMPLAGNNGLRVVEKQGLRVEGGLYNAALLGGLEGQQVQVRLDETNAGYVYVFDLDGKFICMAEDPLLTGVSLRELAMARAATQKAVTKAKVKEAREIVNRVKPAQTAALILEQKAKQAEANRLARLEGAEPFQEENYETSGLVQASLAALSKEAWQNWQAEAAEAYEPSQEELTAQVRLEAEFRLESQAKLASTKKIVRAFDDLDEREAFWLALQLEKDIASKLPLNKEKIKWLYHFQASTEYRAACILYKDVGDDYFVGIREIAI